MFTHAGATDAATLEFKVQKLTEGNKYFFKIYAQNEVGASEPGMNDEPITAKLPFDPPGPPISFKIADVTKSSAQLSWQPPESDGGAPVTGYYVEKNTGKRWSKVNKKAVSSLELLMQELIEKETYEVRVYAENEAGAGSPCEPISFVAKDPFTVPGQPDAPEVTQVDEAGAHLTWQPPVSDGGSAITSYVIEMRKRGDAKWTVVNERVEGCAHTAADIVADVDYEFRVAAENKAGRGPPSEPSKPARYGTTLLLSHFQFVS